ncbi:MAG: hypothetical protein O2910_02955, partial [Proteobacteria bacterium]|nr:hypothetical protein [Pseudomonadota bacterium]
GLVVGDELNLKEVPAWVLKTLAKLNAAGAMVTGNEPAITPEIAAMMTGWSACSSQKAIDELGYRDLPWRQSLKDSYDWLEAERLI